MEGRGIPAPGSVVPYLFLFLFGRCVGAEAATAFTVELDFLLASNLPAFEATLLLVTSLVGLAMFMTPLLRYFCAVCAVDVFAIR